MGRMWLSCLFGTILLFSVVGCGALQTTATTVPPTPTLVPPTGTPCPYTFNPGPPPPEVEKRAQDAFFAMGATGIRGKLRVEAIGEYSCSHFGIEAVNFEYTLIVPDLEDTTRIEEYVATVTASAKDSVGAWNLGDVSVRFIAGKECHWNELQNACAPIEPLMNL